MTSIFDGKYNVSTEMIATQANDPVIEKITNCFEAIRVRMKEITFMSNLDMSKDRKVTLVLEELDKHISERFGIHFKHVLSDAMGYGIYTAPPKNYNILNPDIEDIYESTKDWFGNSNEKATDRIKYFEKDYEAVMKKWLTSVEGLDKVLNSKGVIVDREKAKITGLPKEYVLFIVMDLKNFMEKYNQSNRNFTAITLHEIGHGFTHIENSVRTVRNTSVILEAIADSLIKKNKSGKESLLIAYEKAYPDKKTELDLLKQKNVISVAINFSSDYLKDCVGFNPTKRASIDSEQLADQFVSRFGLTSELAEGLTNIYDKEKYALLKAYGETIGTAALLSFAYGFILSNILWIGFLSAGVSIAMTIGIIIISSLIRSIITVGGLLENKTYDTNKKRLMRVKADIIRQIRSYNNEPEFVKQLLADLNSTTKIIDSLPDDTDGLVDGFMKKHTTKGNVLSEYNAIEESIEFLMENDLHVSSAKFKLLKENR